MPDIKLSQTKSWIRRAMDVADSGDRWFVSIAQGISAAGEFAAKRARAEVAIAAESAEFAADTTVKVGRGIVNELAKVSVPARVATKDKALIKVLAGAVMPYAEGLETLTQAEFQQLQDELKDQVGFEVRLAVEARAEANAKTAKPELVPEHASRKPAKVEPVTVAASFTAPDDESYLPPAEDLDPEEPYAQEAPLREVEAKLVVPLSLLSKPEPEEESDPEEPVTSVEPEPVASVEPEPIASDDLDQEESDGLDQDDSDDPDNADSIDPDQEEDEG